MKKTYEILLPSFIRRIIKPELIKTEVRLIGAILQRKGRSRNWILKANLEQIEKIVTLVHKSEEPSWQWLIQHISSYKKMLTHDDLMQIAKAQPNITINQLTKKTDCTLSEARRIIDELEGL